MSVNLFVGLLVGEEITEKEFIEAEEREKAEDFSDQYHELNMGQGPWMKGSVLMEVSGHEDESLVIIDKLWKDNVDKKLIMYMDWR